MLSAVEEGAAAGRNVTHTGAEGAARLATRDHISAQMCDRECAVMAVCTHDERDTASPLGGGESTVLWMGMGLLIDA